MLKYHEKGEQNIALKLGTIKEGEFREGKN